jgi:2'-5' RNA ligase
MRLFVAVQIPEAHRDHIHAMAMRLKKELPKVRASWVPAENYHVTLQFLGNTGLSTEVFRLLEKLTTPGFTLGLGGVGAFPDERKASVVWMGAGLGALPGGSELAQLALEIEGRLKPLGFTRDKPFSGHLTVAKVKIPTDISAILAPEKGALLDPYPVKEILVYESKTTPNGSRYHELQRFPLA